MGAFEYTALDNGGKERKGILEGDNEALGVEETSNIVFGECAHQRVKG